MPREPIPAPLPRTARLLTPAGFRRVFAHGRRLGTRSFSLHLLATEGPVRLGLAVSRRVDARAVVRNRIKRLVRESFRHVRAELPPADCVIVARREAAQQDNAGLRAELQALWRRAAALKPGPADGTMRAAASDRAVPAPTSEPTPPPVTPGQPPTRR